MKANIMILDISCINMWAEVWISLQEEKKGKEKLEWLKKEEV